MAKRFTDTDKWKKKWFRQLKNDHKVFWMYLLDQCDHAGIWEVDFDLASYFCNGIKEKEIRDTFVKQYHEFMMKRLGKKKFKELNTRSNIIKKKRDFINKEFRKELKLMLENE